MQHLFSTVELIPAIADKERSYIQETKPYTWLRNNDKYLAFIFCLTAGSAGKMHGESKATFSFSFRLGGHVRCFWFFFVCCFYLFWSRAAPLIAAELKLREHVLLVYSNTSSPACVRTPTRCLLAMLL